MTNNKAADTSKYEDLNDLYLPDFFRKEFPNLSKTVLDMFRYKREKDSFGKENVGCQDSK